MPEINILDFIEKCVDERMKAVDESNRIQNARAEKINDCIKKHLTGHIGEENVKRYLHIDGYNRSIHLPNCEKIRISISCSYDNENSIEPNNLKIMYGMAGQVSFLNSENFPDTVSIAFQIRETHIKNVEYAMKSAELELEAANFQLGVSNKLSVNNKLSNEASIT